MKSTFYFSSLSLAAGLIVGCDRLSYPSMHQAHMACGRWVSERGDFEVQESWGWRKMGVRYCQKEKETNQFLGFEREVKEGERFALGDVSFYKRGESVRRNFRY